MSPTVLAAFAVWSWNGPHDWTTGAWTDQRDPLDNYVLSLNLISTHDPEAWESEFFRADAERQQAASDKARYLLLCSKAKTNWSGATSGTDRLRPKVRTYLNEFRSRKVTKAIATISYLSYVLSPDNVPCSLETAQQLINSWPQNHYLYNALLYHLGKELNFNYWASRKQNSQKDGERVLRLGKDLLARYNKVHEGSWQSIELELQIYTVLIRHANYQHRNTLAKSIPLLEKFINHPDTPKQVKSNCKRHLETAKIRLERIDKGLFKPDG